MFGKNRPDKVSSSSLIEEFNKIVNIFNSAIEQLLGVAKKANEEKAAKEQEITELQTEAANLEAVSNKATAMAEKIGGLLS